MLRTLKQCLAGMAALSSAGCFPVLTHGARVDPGARLGFTSAIQAVSRPAPLDSSSPGKVIPGIDFGTYLAVAGRPASWQEGGVRVTGSLNLSSAFVADVYAQLPVHLPGASATGIGILYQPRIRDLVFPYLMNGWDLPDKSQLHATVGLANTSGIAEGHPQRSFLFVASIGLQTPSVGRTLRALPGFSTYVMFIAGRQGPDCRSSNWCIGGTSRFIFAFSADLPSFRRRCPGAPSGDPNTGRCAPPGGPRRPPPGRIPPMRADVTGVSQ